MSSDISRRRFLGSLGIAGAGLAVGGAGGSLLSGDSSMDLNRKVPFYGQHQAGVITPQQDRIHIAAFDVVDADRDEVISMLKQWTNAVALMTAGKNLGEIEEHPAAPPTDTGEAVGLPPANLTVTVGFGPTMFSKDGVDRFGLAGKRPSNFGALPTFPRDALESARSDGDIVVQACADDPQVTFHAIRNLARIGRGTVAMRWSQMGFGRTASTSKSQATPRNLFGMKDGTNNVKSEDEKAMREMVWADGADGAQPWMTGGTYMACRRIRMLTEIWDRSPLSEQEATFGRTKLEGSPLGKAHEVDTVDLSMNNSDGTPTIPMDAHIRLAAPSTNNGAQMLRRGYSFTDGMDPATGQLDAGLFFIAYVRDLEKQFVPVQRKLSSSDAMNEYVKYTSSAAFLVPPGVQQGGYLGEGLFT